MAFPRVPKKYADKTRVERAIDNYAAMEKPGIGDLNYVDVVAQVERGIDKYRAAALNMTVDELEDERHQSGILAHFLAASGDPRPHSRCHAHAIVSGAHQYAATLRAIIARFRLRIDDPDNGCWLPENTAAASHMPKRLKNAIPHSRIHRYNYYFWLRREINPYTTQTLGQLRQVLNIIEFRIQSGSYPKYVMNRKSEGLPA